MRDDLLDAQAALDWAVTQIPSLQEAFLVWQRGNPYRIVQERDPDGGPDFAVAYQEKPLPRALNAWVGAIINSIAAASMFSRRPRHARPCSAGRRCSRRRMPCSPRPHR